MHQLFCTLLCLLFTTGLYAQLSLTGTVLSAEDNTAIPFANLLILGSGQGASADAVGKFTLPFPSPGTSDRAPMAVQVSAVGFRADTFMLQPAQNVTLILERAADLPTITVNGGKYYPLKERKVNKYLPVHLTRWGDRVATCYKRSGKRVYQLRLVDAYGKETRHDLTIGKIEGITSHCSERLYVLTQEYAVSFELEGGRLVPIERIPRNDFKWLFADCRDRQGDDYLYEKQRLRGMNKLYLLLTAASEEYLVREYLDSALVHEYFYGVPIMDFDWVETKNPPMWASANSKGRRAQAMAHFDQNILYNNHNDNPYFFAGQEIKLVNFDEGLLETFSKTGEPLDKVPFKEEVDKRVKLGQRIFRDPLSGRTLVLAKEPRGHRLYHFDLETGKSRLLFRLNVEMVEELVVLDERFYLLARQDRFGPESAWRIYEGALH